MSEQLLDMSVVRIDGDTQPRTAINPGIVQEYAEAMQAGAEFPAVTIVHDGAAYWLVDGFHRFFAHRRLARKQIRAEVIAGELKDARWLSVSANKAHGLRRSNGDKAKAIIRALRLRSDLSNRAIAEHVGVSYEMVRQYREILERQKAAQVTTVVTSPAEQVPTVGTSPAGQVTTVVTSPATPDNMTAGSRTVAGAQNAHLPARIGRDGKQYPGRKASQLTHTGSPPALATLVNMPRDPAQGANTLIKLFTMDYLRALVKFLSSYLEQLPATGQPNTS